MLSSPFAIKKTFTELPEMNWDRLHKITTSRNQFQSHSCKVVSKASCFLSISVWGVLKFRYPQVKIPWLLWYISGNSLTGLMIMIVYEKVERIYLDFFQPSISCVCVRIAPIFFEISMCENATSQSGSLSTVRQFSTNSGNQHKKEWYSLWLQKGVNFPSRYEFQSLNLRLVYDYVCHSVGKVSCTPYTEIWVLTPFWERFSWSVYLQMCVLQNPDISICGLNCV